MNKKTVFAAIILMGLMCSVDADRLGNCYVWNTDVIYTPRGLPYSQYWRTEQAHLNAMICPNLLYLNGSVNCTARFTAQISFTALNVTVFDPTYYDSTIFEGFAMLETDNITNSYPNFDTYLYEYPSHQGSHGFIHITNTTTTLEYTYNLSLGNLCGNWMKDSNYAALLVYTPYVTTSVFEQEDNYTQGNAIRPGIWLRDIYHKTYVITTTTATTTTVSTTSTTLYGNVSFETCFNTVESVCDNWGNCNNTNLPNSVIDITWEEDGILATVPITTDSNGIAYYTLSVNQVYTIDGYNNPKYPKVITYPSISGYTLAQETECIPIALTKSGNLNADNFNFNVYTSYDSLPLNPSYNTISGYECIVDSDYDNYDSMINNCDLVFRQYGTFNYSTANRYLISHAIGLIDRYDDVTYHFKLPAILRNLQKNTSYTFFYGGGVTNNEVCFDFISKDSQTPASVNYLITEASTPSMSGFGNSKCFNTADLGKLYEVTTSGNSSFYDSSALYRFSDVQRTVNVELRRKDISGGLSYVIGGFILDSSNSPISGVTVKETGCIMANTITSAGGYYQFIPISAGSYCTIKTSTNGEYIDQTKSVNLNGNMTLNFSLTKPAGNTNSLSISAHTQNDYGNALPLNGAKVTLHCAGLPDMSDYTSGGTVTFYNIQVGADCSYSIEKADFTGRNDVTVNPGDYGNGIDIEVQSTAALSCNIVAKAELNNGASTLDLTGQNILILNSDGSQFDSRYTDGSGNINAPVNCGETYTLSSVYGGIKKTVSVRVQEIEGAVGRVTLEFNPTEIGHQNIGSNILGYLWSLTYFVVVIIILFILYVMVNLVDKIVRTGSK